MDSPRDRTKALREDMKNWADDVFVQALQYQNACWWIVPKPERALLLDALRLMSGGAATVRDVLLMMDLDS